MLKKDSNYISICLNDELVKIAHLEIGGAVKLVNVAKKDIRGLPEEEIPKVIQSLLNGMNIKRADAACVLPSLLVTTKNIEIPSRDPAEIKSIINLQAGRHTPYSREEILISYVNIGVYQTNYTKVLLVIINRNVVKKQISILEKSGLRIDRVLFAPEGMSRFYSRALNLAAEEVPVGIIDVGSVSTDFLIEFHETVIACRSIAIGMKELTSLGQEARDKLIAEIAKSVESYQSEDIDKMPATYILTSDDIQLKELQPALKERLKVNVKIVPYLDHMEAAQSALLKIIQEFNGESFLDVIAPAQLTQAVQVDLMPEEMKLKKSIEEQSRQIINFGVRIFLILILVFGVFSSKLQMKNLRRNNLTEDYTKMRKEVESLEELTSKTGIVKDYLNTRMTALDIVGELYKVVPQEIYLESVDINEKGSIDIRGTSDSMSQVFSLVTALEESGLFKSVKTKSTTAKKERGKDVAAFDIAFKLESAKDDDEESSGDKSAEKKAEEKESK